MAKTGLSYYQAETDRFQDIKIKRLKKRYGCEGYAVYQYIQNEIYRVEGCYIRFTGDQLFDVSEYWGIDEERVEAIIEYCVEVELFDAITWHTKQVLTSADIQQRYVEICRRAKKKIIIPEDIRLVETQQEAAAASPAAGSAPLPLFSGQEIETKTGKTVYGTPKLADAGTVAISPASAAVPMREEIPQSSAEIRETPQNSAEKQHKEKENKENPPSTPQAVSPIREEEDKAPLFFHGENPQVSAEEYSRKLKHLSDVCRSMGCAQDDLRQILRIEHVALDDSPIWALMQDVRQGGGRYSFNGYVIQSLRALIMSGRLKVCEAEPEPVLGMSEMRRLLASVGVASYEIDGICEAAAGKEQALKEAIEAVRRSKGKILMPECFIRSKLEKAPQKGRKTA